MLLVQGGLILLELGPEVDRGRQIYEVASSGRSVFGLNAELCCLTTTSLSLLHRFVQPNVHRPAQIHSYPR